MTNDEIGTYQICEAIQIDPKLKCVKDKQQLIAVINGVRHVGNLTIIKKCVKMSQVKFRKTEIDNYIVQEKDIKSVLSDIYGISTDLDKKIVYDESEIWELAQQMATKKEKKANKSGFKLNINGHTGLI